MDITLFIAFMLVNMGFGLFAVLLPSENSKIISKLSQTQTGRIFILCTGFIWAAIGFLWLIWFLISGLWKFIRTGELE